MSILNIMGGFSSGGQLILVSLTALFFSVVRSTAVTHPLFNTTICLKALLSIYLHLPDMYLLKDSVQWSDFLAKDKV